MKKGTKYAPTGDPVLGIQLEDSSGLGSSGSNARD